MRSKKAAGAVPLTDYNAADDGQAALPAGYMTGHTAGIMKCITLKVIGFYNTIYNNIIE